MKQQISILGLGQIGTSFSLALKPHAELFERVGYDPNTDVLKEAHKMGFVDRKEANVVSAVKDADLVLFGTPDEDFSSSLETIASALKGGVIFLDASPLISMHIDQAQDILEADCFFVGFNPIINPKYLQGVDVADASATHDLFENGIVAITPAKNTPAEIVDYVVHLTKLVGATPLFGDPMEIDSFITAAYLMPKVIAAAFFADVSSQASWREIQRITGHPFMRFVEMLGDEDTSNSLVAALLANPENATWRLNGMIQILTKIKELVHTNDHDTLQTIFETAQQAVTESRKTRFTHELSSEDRDQARSKATDVIRSFLWPGRRRKRLE